MIDELSLFTGAGGGLLANKLLNINTIAAVEFNQYAVSVLKQRQKEGFLEEFPIYGNIKEFSGYAYRGRVALLSGGFPCQAFSKAACGKNNAENLWPEMLRVIKESQPPLVFAENVTFEAINKAAKDCRRIGYKTKILPLSAKDLGADHIRERYWLLGYTNGTRELLQSIDAEASLLRFIRHSIWRSDYREPRVSNGVANRMERIRATGNGQLPIVAASALCILALAALEDLNKCATTRIG